MDYGIQPMTTIVPGAAEAGSSLRATSFYRAVWRWHFYAGLLCLPFMILLAVTGGLYLFRYEIDDFIYRDLKRVEAATAPTLAPSAQVEAALAAYPGTLFKYVPPLSPQGSAEIGVRTEGGEKLSVYVNPYDGRVLGTIADRGSVMWVVRELHSLAYFGPLANAVIEIVGGWSILLVGTGIYLWWPRGKGGVVRVRGRPKQRVFWRDLHAVVGLFAGFFIAFLAITGMPWSVFWGKYVNQWANGTNFGYPAGVRVEVPMSDEHLGHATGGTTWSLEQARMPQSTAEAGSPLGLDAAVAIFDRLDLAKGYAVNPPDGPSGVYTASVYPADLSQQRVVHLDQYSGTPLIDMSYADYGPAGRWLEWGINVHMGQEFGLANQIFFALVCLAIVLLSLSAGVMWWKRRPARALGVPPPPAERSVLRGVVAILLIGGVIFPLVGASLLVMLLLDRLFARQPRRG